MSFGEAIAACFAKYASFEGRARRREYWYFALFFFIIYAVAFAVGAAISSDMAVVFAGLVVLALFIPSISVTVRRLHDTGRSGWWYWISLVPLIGGVWLLVLTLLDSTQEPNEYGPSPKYAG